MNKLIELDELKLELKNTQKLYLEALSRIDKAIEHLNKRNEQNYSALSNPENTIISKHQLLDLEITNNNILLEILGGINEHRM